MYDVLIESAAERDLKRLPADVFQRLIPHIKALADNPRPSGCRKITDSKGDWRIRVGDYRVIYEIDDPAKAVRIMHARHRKEAY
ncbi:MAG: type II toxin-antitoxin system RelE/ParE family toxin [Chloroflexi bacterium]|nr:type II toxin-antitoxin system RelE/ParE family toxin [Chloroflexota bacterium]